MNGEVELDRKGGILEQISFDDCLVTISDVSSMRTTKSTTCKTTLDRRRDLRCLVCLRTDQSIRWTIGPIQRNQQLQLKWFRLYRTKAGRLRAESVAQWDSTVPNYKVRNTYGVGLKSGRKQLLLEISDGVLRVRGKEFNLGRSVTSATIYDNCVVAVLEYKERKSQRAKLADDFCYNQGKDNVICLNNDGSVRWRIEPLVRRRGASYGWSHLEHTVSGEILACTRMGVRYQVDMKTGKTAFAFANRWD